MKTKLWLAACLLLFFSITSAAPPPGTTSEYIKIDQFGYLPGSKKVAVIVDPQVGYNAAESFNPGTGADQYQVRRWSDDVVVFSGTLTAWGGGDTHTQSGDKGWWFDFSSVTSTGSYYIFDVANNVGSYQFEIGPRVYDEVLKQAMRTFFYQRINFAKQTPYTDAKWADGACMEGANQDKAARLYTDVNNAATAKDLSGGWMDAGDFNKYVTFTPSPVCNLLESYRTYPAIFKDNYNIPESGNGIPDVLDEIKWELDWLKRMQDGTGTDGFLMKIGFNSWNAVGNPPSTDNNPRFYVPECTSSTLSGCAIFALAGNVYKSLGNTALTDYANDLTTRAINAWNRAKVTTSNFTSFKTDGDDQTVKAGDADISADEQTALVVTAAAYLYEATGDVEYKNWFETMYTKVTPISGSWWGPYNTFVQKALLRYTTLSGATPSVVANIKSIKGGQNGVMSITDYTNKTDLYRASTPDGQYHWGSNKVKAECGLNNLDFLQYGINAADIVTYKETVEGYLHWFHGINPMTKVFLSNMGAYGAEKSVNEFYHNWFGDGTPWDDVQTSTYGPAPGYVTGGPNKDFTISSITPPAGQPVQKAYKEWNAGSEQSWEITENAIYYQGAYVSLLAGVIANAASTTLPIKINAVSANRNNLGALVSWTIGNTNNETKQFEVQRSFNGKDFVTINTITALGNRTQYELQDDAVEVKTIAVYYRIKEISKSGEIFYSQIIALPLKKSTELKALPNPANSKVTLYGNNNSTGALTCSLYDVSGKLVYSNTWQQLAGSYAKDIPLNSISKGVYWLVVKGKDWKEEMKIIKE